VHVSSNACTTRVTDLPEASPALLAALLCRRARGRVIMADMMPAPTGQSAHEHSMGYRGPGAEHGAQVKQQAFYVPVQWLAMAAGDAAAGNVQFAHFRDCSCVTFRTARRAPATRIRRFTPATSSESTT
jgi:hypothetical protein